MRQQLRKVIDNFFTNMTVVDLRLQNEREKYHKNDRITSNDLMYLHILESRSGEYTVTTLAELLGISKPSVTNKMNELEKKGYIIKKRDEVDKRIQYLCINPDTFETEFFHKKYQELDTAVIEEMTKKYTEEEVKLFMKMIDDIGGSYFTKVVR